MHLVIDIGNTNLNFGVFDSTPFIKQSSKKLNKLKDIFSLVTPLQTTTDQLAFNIENMLLKKGIGKQNITHSIFSSVVPSLNHNITKLMNLQFHQDILKVDHSFFPDYEIDYHQKSDLGIDRLVGLKAAERITGGNIIVVDFGTATTIDVMDSKKRYLGGLILPGVDIALNALIEKTSKLPRVELQLPQKLLGNSTKENIQNGIYYLNSWGIEAVVEKIKAQYFPSPLKDSKQTPVNIFFTGGLSHYICNAWATSKQLNQDLILKGLKIILDEKINQTS